MNPVGWYVACRSNDVPRERSCKPARGVVLGQPLAIFRDSAGNCVALLDRCPHRNVALSEGRTHEGVLQCPYHGWEFDGSGSCVKIPGLGPGEAPLPHHRATAFRAVEQDGLVWVWPDLSREPSPARPEKLPFYGDPGYTSFFIDGGSSRATLLNALENLLDATHTHFVHPGLIRKEGKRRPVKATVRLESDRVETAYENEGVQSGLISRIFGSSEVQGLGRFVYPSIGQLEYRDCRGTKLVLSVLMTPSEDGVLRSVIVTTFRRPRWLPGAVGSFLIAPFLKLGLKQDRKILALQAENLARFGGKESYRYSQLDVMRPHLHRLLKMTDAGPEGTSQTVTLWL